MRQIVHFGLGNFARAHLLDYTADAGGGWTVIGVNLAPAPRAMVWRHKTMPMRSRSKVLGSSRLQ